jgi:hypothetical protein
LGLFTCMKTIREFSHQELPGADRILMVLGIVLLACAVYLLSAVEHPVDHRLHPAKALAAVESLLGSPICFLVSLRELIRYRRSWAVVIAVCTSALAATIAWLAVVLIVSGKLPVI